jgi:hypothetical protein
MTRKVYLRGAEWQLGMDAELQCSPTRAENTTTSRVSAKYVPAHALLNDWLDKIDYVLSAVTRSVVLSDRLPDDW